MCCCFFSVRAGHLVPEVCRAWGVSEGLLRDQPGGHHRRGEEREDLRPQPPPPVTQNAQAVKAHAIRRVRRSSQP